MFTSMTVVLKLITSQYICIRVKNSLNPIQLVWGPGADGN